MINTSQKPKTSESNEDAGIGRKCGTMIFAEARGMEIGC